MRDDQLHKLQKYYGKNLPIFLEALARGKQFRQALETPLGSEILATATKRLEDLIDKVIQEISTPEERAEIRALKRIINEWSVVINKYMTDHNKFKTIAGD